MNTEIYTLKFIVYSKYYIQIDLFSMTIMKIYQQENAQVCTIIVQEFLSNNFSTCGKQINIYLHTIMFILPPLQLPYIKRIVQAPLYPTVKVIYFHFLQSAVRAAVEGRVLILEGIEKAERNVLPVLNNLLENREMHLEDGRFLIPASRYDKLLQVITNSTDIPAL